MKHECIEKIGGPSWGENKCPDCGKVDRRYYLGSWDWEPRVCLECLKKSTKRLERALNKTRSKSE